MQTIVLQLSVRNMYIYHRNIQSLKMKFNPSCYILQLVWSPKNLQKIFQKISIKIVLYVNSYILCNCSEELKEEFVKVIDISL